MITEPAKAFSRKFRGYDPAEVDAHIEVLTTKQQLLLDDVESLRARLEESGAEAAALRNEVSTLTDTSSSPQAVQTRMSQMLRRAVEEMSEVQAEARAEADALIAAAESEAAAALRESEERLAELAAQREALEAECEETREKHDAELAKMRAETQSAIEGAWQDAEKERERLLADAKQEADRYREQARRAVDEASQQRIRILEQLAGVHRELAGVPTALEAAYEEQDDPDEESAEANRVVTLHQKTNTG